MALALMCTTARARANGRFPAAQAIESVPGDASTLFLRATFGILVSRDKGTSWRWICERAMGYGGQWDPPIAVTRDGRLWVGLDDGLVATRDGCEVERARELDGHTIKDLTVDPTGNVVWAITGAPGKTSYVWKLARLGERFERLASFDDTNLMTLEVAPSDPKYVYVSGQPYSTIRGQVFRSTDGGRSFLTAKNELEAEGPFFLGAIDPKDKYRLLLRHLHGKGSDLLLSRDGGKTLTNVLSMASAMFGFAKTDDGSTYWAGSGLAEHGLFRSSDRGEHFELVSNSAVLCLHCAQKDALFACENILTLGAPAVGVFRNQGATHETLARFSDILGPVSCAARDAGASICEASWSETRDLLTPRPAAPPTSEAAARVRSGEEDTGATRASGDRRNTRRGCGCGLVGQPSRSEAAVPLLALSVLARARRKRRPMDHRLLS
jgi:photosystem II stability/assembly factor-like uncharacterized protein